MFRRHALSPALLAVLALLALLAACEEDPESDDGKDTVTDPLGDIAHLDSYFFGANDDRSGNTGPQVDLFKFAMGGFPVDRFPLDINGQGYLAAAADSQWIYLQARGTGQLFKVSPVGEIAWTRGDPHTGPGALACGVLWRADVDSFEILYRDAATTTVAIRRYGPGFDGEPGSVRTVEAAAFAPDAGPLAATWADGSVWMLGHDAGGSAVIEGFDDAGAVTDVIPLDDPDACGLTADGDILYIAYPDRSFALVDLTEGTP
jgi:hypothetical protein